MKDRKRIHQVPGNLNTGPANWTKALKPTRPTFNAERFRPHLFQTEKLLMPRAGFTNPHVLIEPAAFNDMFYIAGHAGHNEVGWLGTVERTDDVLRIAEIFLFDQEVTPSETDLNTQHIATVVTELLQNGQIDKVNAIKFWGHVHPGNSTSPSAQDNQTMTDQLSDGNEWFLRGIFGRNGRAEFWLFDYTRGIIFKDIPWDIALPEDQERKKTILDMVLDLVHSRAYVQTAYDYSYPKKIGGFARDTVGIEIEKDDDIPV